MNSTALNDPSVNAIAYMCVDMHFNQENTPGGVNGSLPLFFSLHSFVRFYLCIRNFVILIVYESRFAFIWLNPPSSFSLNVVISSIFRGV